MPLGCGCERSCLVPGEYQISIAKYPHIKFERDRLNIFRVIAFMSSESTGGGGRSGDTKTIISPKTSFGDITNLNVQENGTDTWIQIY